jgi:hypothetical protein
MIKCKDFAPQITEQGLFGRPAEYESFSEVVSAVKCLTTRQIFVGVASLKENRLPFLNYQADPRNLTFYKPKEANPEHAAGENNEPIH